MDRNMQNMQKLDRAVKALYAHNDAHTELMKATYGNGAKWSNPGLHARLTRNTLQDRAFDLVGLRYLMAIDNVVTGWTVTSYEMPAYAPGVMLRLKSDDGRFAERTLEMVGMNAS